MCEIMFFYNVVVVIFITFFYSVFFLGLVFFITVFFFKLNRSVKTMDSGFVIAELPPRQRKLRRRRKVSPLSHIYNVYDSLSFDMSKSAIRRTGTYKPKWQIEREQKDRNISSNKEYNKFITNHEKKEENIIDDKTAIHILVIYRNTSICLKFKDNHGVGNQSKCDRNLPIIVNLNLQKLQSSINGALSLMDLSIPTALIILISQYLFPRRECKCKSLSNENTENSLTIFDNVNNFGKIFGTYSLNGKHGHEIIKNYQNIVLKIGDVCNEYSTLKDWIIFDDFIYKNVQNSVSSSYCFDLCRSHYVMKKIK